MEYHHTDLRERYEKLKEYMITLDKLQIDGDTIASYGYRDKEIGLVKKTLTKLVHRQELKNDKEALQKICRFHTRGDFAHS